MALSSCFSAHLNLHHTQSCLLYLCGYRKMAKTNYRYTYYNKFLVWNAITILFLSHNQGQWTGAVKTVLWETRCSSSPSLIEPSFSSCSVVLLFEYGVQLALLALLCIVLFFCSQLASIVSYTAILCDVFCVCCSNITCVKAVCTVLQRLCTRLSSNEKAMQKDNVWYDLEGIFNTSVAMVFCVHDVCIM